LKKNKKGFLLTEALIVITFVSALLFFLFIQFNSLFDNYEKSFRFNSVQGLYRAREVRQFLLANDFSDLVEELEDGVLYVEFSDCSLITPADHCQNLFTDLQIRKAYFVHEDVTGFATYLHSQPQYGDIVYYIDFVDYHRDFDGFRLIIEFENDEFASVNFL